MKLVPKPRVIPNHERRGIRLEKFAHLPRGVWHPELVGVVRGYPKTQALFDARKAALDANIQRQMAAGKWGKRPGTPNGQSRRQQKIDRADRRKAETIARAESEARTRVRVAQHAEAIAQAPVELQRMMDENFIKAETIADAELGNIALKFVTAVVMDNGASLKDRLAAVKILADFTKAKPMTKQEVAFKNSEDFLASLLAKSE